MYNVINQYKYYDNVWFFFLFMTKPDLIHLIRMYNFLFLILESGLIFIY